ncbi:hypothetical protein X768_17465 [Mesorhizobium sp. LSJC265A00]|nr:hypothetical protein X768_17465 [Mesorhizobium sp. LSJC265A00]ESZ56309.1 hypothetical protein X728_26010 [Mesorhizobium sp. L103C120A0]
MRAGPALWTSGVNMLSNVLGVLFRTVEQIGHPACLDGLQRRPDTKLLSSFTIGSPQKINPGANQTGSRQARAARSRGSVVESLDRNVEWSLARCSFGKVM